MSNNDWMVVSITTLALVLFAHVGASAVTRQSVMRGALDRGYAEHCVGTKAVHWKGECPEVRP